jgi:hypothetical protein
MLLRLVAVFPHGLELVRGSLFASRFSDDLSEQGENAPAGSLPLFR